MTALIRRHPHVCAGLLALILICAAAHSAYTFAHLADTMAWDCGGGSCATNDMRSVHMPVALLGTVAATLLSGYAVGLIGPAITIGAASLAFRAGLQAAVADGYSPADSLTVPLTFSMIGLILAGLCLLGWVPMIINRVRVARAVRVLREQRDQRAHRSAAEV